MNKLFILFIYYWRRLKCIRLCRYFPSAFLLLFLRCCDFTVFSSWLCVGHSIHVDSFFFFFFFSHYFTRTNCVHTKNLQRASDACICIGTDLCSVTFTVCSRVDEKPIGRLLHGYVHIHTQAKSHFSIWFRYVLYNWQVRSDSRIPTHTPRSTPSKQQIDEIDEVVNKIQAKRCGRLIHLAVFDGCVRVASKRRKKKTHNSIHHIKQKAHGNDNCEHRATTQWIDCVCSN